MEPHVDIQDWVAALAPLAPQQGTVGFCLCADHEPPASHKRRLLCWYLRNLGWMSEICRSNPEWNVDALINMVY